MALQYWDKKYCKNCSKKSDEDLPQYTCNECETVGCPHCLCNGGDYGDEDGNIEICVQCALVVTEDQRR